MEKALIQAVLNKKKSAFGIFYNEIVDHFYSFLKSSYNLSNEEINDIIADTFIKIRTKLDTFDNEKGDFLNRCWMILRNTAKDFFKKNEKNIYFSQLNSNSNDEKTSFEDTLEDGNNILDILEKDFEKEKIHKAISSLKADEKEILFLKFTENYSLEKIAKILGITPVNARVKLHRILKKLKKLLK